jgi:uncharacterized protein involved in exopolysaccharide biosynthesis
VLIVTAAAAVTVLKKPEFKSEMKFLVEAARSNSVISADRAAAAPVQDVTEEQINSEIELMQSQDVIGAVVDPQWSQVSPESRTRAQVEAHEARIAAFQKHLTVESGHKNNVVSVTYRGESARDAASRLEALSAAYLAERRKLTRPPGTSEFFTDETKRYKDAWDRANQAMVDFQQANGLVSVPDMEEGLSQQIAATENQLRAAQAELAEAVQKEKISGRLAAQISQRQSTQQRFTPNLGAIQQIESSLVQLKNRRTELLNRYQPSDRLVQEVDRQIADTSAALARVEKTREQEDTSDINPAWQQVRNGQVQAIVAKRATQGRIATLKENLSDLHQQLAHIQPLSLQFNQLQEQVDQARNNYEVFSEKRDESNIEDAMDERKLVNIAVAENPTLNFQQVAPRPLLYMALGVLTALFLAASAVYFAESFRNTISTPRELEIVSHYPVLATLPWDAMTAKLNSPHLTGTILREDEVPAFGAGGLGLVAILQKMSSAMQHTAKEREV